MNKNIQSIYDEIAMTAFKNYSLLRENANGIMEEFRLAEIEIYRIDEENNIDDIFIHKHDKQLDFQKEYSHYSGFDICLGDTKNIYCGILVRGITNEKENIYGPGRVKYNRKDRKKTSIKIEMNYHSKHIQELYFSEKIDSKNVDLENIIFKLPRVNLSNIRCSEYINGKKNIERLDRYLNLKARYLRVKDEKFHKLGNTSPEEPREIFNAIINYKQSMKS